MEKKVISYKIKQIVMGKGPRKNTTVILTAQRCNVLSIDCLDGEKNDRILVKNLTMMNDPFHK